MSVGSLVGFAAACNLLCSGIRKRCPQKTRLKIVVEIVYALSFAFLAVAWFGLYFESEGNTHKQVFSMVMAVLSSIVAVWGVLTSIVYAADYHMYKEVRKAEALTKRLQKICDECKCSTYVGVNKVIKCLTEIYKKDLKSSRLVDSIKQVFSFYLPEYVKVYAKYTEAIAENVSDLAAQKLLANQMTECSEKFLQQIEAAKQKQEIYEKGIEENQFNTVSSEFEAAAEAFNAMVDVQDEFSFVQEIPEIPQQNNSKDKNKKQERMLL